MKIAFIGMLILLLFITATGWAKPDKSKQDYGPVITMQRLNEYTCFTVSWVNGSGQQHALSCSR